MIIQCRASQARFEVQHLVVALTERFLTVLYNKFKIFERQLNLLALTIDKQFTIYYIEISSKRNVSFKVARLICCNYCFIDLIYLQFFSFA